MATSAPARDRALIQRLDAYLATPGYVALVMALALISNIFSAELPVYTLYALVAVFIFVHGKDIAGLIPILVGGYISPSVANNPGKNADSVFTGFGGIYIGILAGLMAAACIYRIIRDRKQFRGKKLRLLSGLLILSATYLLGGIGIPTYWETLPNNLLFVALQIGALCVPYVLLCCLVDWTRVRRDYFAWVGFFMGGVLLCQLLWIYLSAEVVIAGVINRANIYTGWGIHNNIGAMLAMSIPFAFYLATKYHKGWLGTVIGSLFFLGTILSCSRNAMLTGAAIYFMGIVLMLYYANNRRGNTIAAMVCICVAAVVVIFFNQQLIRLFSDIIAIGFDPNSRDSLYTKGMKLFYEYPIFGGSFFSPSYKSWGWSTVEAFSSFFPPRWHNTFVQMLASCGVVGMAGYLFHRVQTYRLVFHNHNKEKTFIGCAVLALLVCSLFDCHFFNVGPTLFYSAALAFGEHCHDK